MVPPGAVSCKFDRILPFWSNHAVNVLYSCSFLSKFESQACPSLGKRLGCAAALYTALLFVLCMHSAKPVQNIQLSPQIRESVLQGVPQNMSNFVFLHFSQQSNIKKPNLMVPSNFLLNSLHENVQKLFLCWKNNQVISIFPTGLKTPQNTSHPPWKPCLGEKGTIHLFSQLKH